MFVNVPVWVLLKLKYPDRDIYRMIVMNKSMTTKEVQKKLNITMYGVNNALTRLGRLDLIKAVVVKGIGQRNKIIQWTVNPNPKTTSTLSLRGRVTNSEHEKRRILKRLQVA